MSSNENMQINKNKKVKKKEKKKEKKNENDFDNNELTEQDKLNPPFYFLEKKRTDPIIYDLYSNEPSELKKQFGGRYKYLICILLTNDSKNDSFNLNFTIKSIQKNLTSLQKIGINYKEILICIFLTQSNFLLKPEELSLLKNKKDFIIIPYQTDGTNYEGPIDAFVIGKKVQYWLIDSLKCFYLGICKDIKSDSKFILSSMSINGVTLNEDTIKNLILSSNEKLKPFVAVPAAESISNGLFGNVERYESIHYNLYNLNFYDITCCVPINSIFNVMKIDDSLLEKMEGFYNILYPNATLSYHDYALSLHLYQNLIKINYINSVNVYYNKKTIDYTDYMNDYVNKYAGIYGNFFEFLRVFINCNVCEVQKKIFMFFRLIGIFGNFIYPSLSMLVIYTILYECFNIFDGRSAAFFTALYCAFMVYAGTVYSKFEHPKTTKITSYIIFFFFEVYHLFILICSIVAMDHVKKNKNHNRYKFNKAAISLLIILTFIFAIFPFLFGIGKIINNIVNMFMYLLLGASPANSVFLISYIFNSSDGVGKQSINERKGLLLLIFYLFNLFFGGLVMFNTDRTRRVNTVLILAIIYCVYNFFKIVGIIVRMAFADNKIDDMNIIKLEAEVRKEIESNVIKQVNGYNRNSDDKKYENYNNNNNDINNANNNNDNYYYNNNNNNNNNMYTNNDNDYNNDQNNNNNDYNNNNNDYNNNNNDYNNNNDNYNNNNDNYNNNYNENNNNENDFSNNDNNFYDNNNNSGFIKNDENKVNDIQRELNNNDVNINRSNDSNEINNNNNNNNNSFESNNNNNMNNNMNNNNDDFGIEINIKDEKNINDNDNFDENGQ